ncbi:MAG: hypothetical protein R3B57_12355 [Phycisphaerales bacterium]
MRTWKGASVPTTSSDLEPRRRSRYAFRISVLAIIPALITLGLFMTPVFLADLDPMQFSQAAGYMVGTWIMRVVICLLLAWLVGMMFRDSRVATTVTFSISVVLCPVALPLGWRDDLGLTPSAQSQAAANDVKRLNDEFRERRLRDLEEKGYMESGGGAAMIDESVGRLEAAAGDGTDIGSRLLRANASVLRAVQTIQSRYEADTARLIELGGLEPPHADSDVNVLDQRIEVIDRMEATNSEMIETLGSLPALLDKAYAAEGVVGRSRESAARAFMRNSQIPLVLRVRRSDMEVLRAGREMLVILKETHGRWWSDEDGFWFEDSVPDETIAQYNDAYKRMTAAIQEQARVQRELFNAQGADGASATPPPPTDGPEEP